MTSNLKMSYVNVILCGNGCYRNDPKFLDRYAWANSTNPDQTAQSDQGLHCLQFPLHRLDALLCGRAT